VFKVGDRVRVARIREDWLKTQELDHTWHIGRVGSIESVEIKDDDDAIFWVASARYMVSFYFADELELVTDDQEN